VTAVLEVFGARAGHEIVLAGLIVAILVLGALVLAFGVTAVVLRARNVRMEHRWERVEAGWEAAILGYLDGDRTAESVRALVADRDGLLFVDFVSRFARRLRGPEREALTVLIRPHLPPVAARLTHPHDAVRARAVATLGLLGMNDYVREVVGALDDPSPLVAMVATRALARREHPQFAYAILGRLHRFLGWQTSFLAAMLVAIGPEAVPALLAAFTDAARPPRELAVIAEALRLLNCLAAADPAARQLAATADRDLAASCLRLLAHVGRPEHLDAVRARAADADPTVRAQAIAAFGTLAEAGEVAALVPALDDPDAWVRLEAARALARIPDGIHMLRAEAAGTGARARLAGQVLAEAAA
jgi:HEAT repeat protein